MSTTQLTKKEQLVLKLSTANEPEAFIARALYKNPKPSAKQCREVRAIKNNLVALGLIK